MPIEDFDFGDIPDLTGGDDTSIYKTKLDIEPKPSFERENHNSATFKNTEESFSGIDSIDKEATRLAKNGAGNLNPFSRWTMKVQAGQMTKEQLIKSLDLHFNAQYHHAAFTLALRLDEENKKAFSLYLEKDTEVKHGLAIELQKAHQKTADSIFIAIEKSFECRKSWQDKINRLFKKGFMSKEEADEQMVLANQERLRLQHEAIADAEILYAALRDKAEYGLNVAIKELTEKVSL